MLPDLVRGLCHSTSVLLEMEKVTVIPGDKVLGWWPTLPATGPSCLEMEQWGWKCWHAQRNQFLFFPEKSPGGLGVPCPRTSLGAASAASSPTPGGFDEVEQRIVPSSHMRDQSERV